MLGVRRASISERISWFEQRGLLKKKRGLISILDRPRLQTLSCGCYRIIRKEQERVLAPVCTENLNSDVVMMEAAKEWM